MRHKRELPSWVRQFVHRICGSYWSEGIHGDLEENFRIRLKNKGRRSAFLFMYLELLGLLRFIFYKKDKPFRNSNLMFKAYFKIGFRVLLRTKVYSAINLFGLAAGMASTLLIYLWIQDEISYDRFHEDVDQLYRVEFDNGNINNGVGTPAELGPAMKAQIPQISGVTRFRSLSGFILQRGADTFHENSGAGADPDFFEMFTFNFLAGDEGTALTDPYSLVLTESLASKYFGQENPIGQTINLNNEHNMTVRAVIEDVPDNSSFQFDFLFPFEFFKPLGRYSDNWSSVWLNTYVKIGPSVDKERVANIALNTIMKDKSSRWEEEYTKAMVFNPFKSMRLLSYQYTGSGFAQKNLQSIFTFSGLGILILVIACINFMNLSTARSAKRAKEIGMRKVIGAVKKNIRMQFLGESFMQTVFSLLLAIGFVFLLLSPFNQLSGKSMDTGNLLQPNFLIGAALVTILVGLISGSYPAFYLSTFQPVKVLKGRVTASGRNANLRKVLVVIQFGLSIFLIISTLVIYYQMQFIQNKELGYDKESVVYIPLLHEDTKAAFDRLKTQWLTIPEISNVSASQAKPASVGYSASAEWEGRPEDDYRDIYMNRISFDYLETMGIPLLEGRDYSTEFLSDDAADRKGGFIINETLAKEMKSDGQVLGMNLAMVSNEGPVVGVMKDHHFMSLKNTIQPMVLMLNPGEKQYALLKLGSNNINSLKTTLTIVERTWSDLLPDYPFEYHFFDEDFERMYRSDERLGKLIGTFSILAIIIASLGLFGLASFTAEERRKEIAIRKVLGADHWKVTYLLCRDFLLLVLLANVIAGPLGKWIMGNWLAGFAYKISFGWEIFVVSALLAFIIALLTIVWQTLKVALANPVMALKHE